MSSSTLNRRIAELALFFIAVIWGAAFVAQRTAMQHLGPFAFNGIRFLLGAAVIWTLIASKAERTRITRTDIYLGAALGIILFTGASLQQVGVVTTSAGKAGFITGLYVVLIPFFLWLVWRQLTSTRVWCGITAAIVGLFMLSVGEDFSLQLGDVWVTLCAAAFAWHVILTGRWVQGRDPWNLAAIQFSIVALLSLLVAALREPFSVSDVTSVWIEILYAGILSVGVGYTGQIVAQKYTSSVVAGIILSLESVFAALAGWIMLAEVFSATQKAGCLLMLLGTIVAQVFEQKPQAD